MFLETKHPFLLKCCPNYHSKISKFLRLESTFRQRMKSNLKLKDIFVPVKNWSRKNAFLLVTIVSVLVGIVLGFLLRLYADLNEIEKSYVGFPGEIFLRMIKLLILPLIVSSLISSIGNIAKKNIGKQNYLCHFCSCF